MSWKTIKMGEVAISIQPGPFGSQLHSSDYSSEGTPIIMPKDMVDGRISHADLLFVSDEHVKRLSRHQVHPGNLMVARKGDVRKCVYISENEDGWMTGSDCLKVALNEESCFPRFIYYQLRSPYIGKWLETISIGATMPSLNSGLLGSIELYLPPIEVQERVSSILSVYDDLIETNQRQIKLLEEAAQRLYKEWFVDLRYPGHENVPVVDGVPNGWKKTVFSERVDVLSGGTPKTSNPEYYNGTIPFYSPKDSDDRFYAFDTETHISESGLENCNSKLYPEGTIIITARGTVGKTTILAKPMAMNQSCYALRSSQVSSVFFLFFALRQEILALKAMANGGVFDTIIVKTFDRINLTTPSAPVIQAFDKLVTPIMEKMKSLLIENRNLSEARDRLLPKLMSGEITV